MFIISRTGDLARGKRNLTPPASRGVIKPKRRADGTVVQVLADYPPLTNSESAQLRLVPNPKEIRRRKRLTQVQVARRFQLPLGTPRDWEQAAPKGLPEPDSAAKSYLGVIDKNPQAVIDALET